MIKSEESVEQLAYRLEQGAKNLYGVESFVRACIEEIINIPRLREYFRKAVEQKYPPAIIDEIYSEETGAVEVEDVTEDDSEEQVLNI